MELVQIKIAKHRSRINVANIVSCVSALPNDEFTNHELTVKFNIRRHTRVSYSYGNTNPMGSSDKLSREILEGS